MGNRKIKIYPSILSADFSNLGQEIESVTEGGADGIHIDIMDGQFVPPITFGPMIVPFIRDKTHLPLDVHMMVDEPDRYFEELVGFGVDSITVHLESCKDIQRTLSILQTYDVVRCLAINPKTAQTALTPLLDYIDQVLIMSVEPGYGGQAFIPSSLTKIKEVKKILIEKKSNVALQVDGGVNGETIGKVSAAGADIVVAGSAVFNSQSTTENINHLRKRAGEIS